MIRAEVSSLRDFIRLAQSSPIHPRLSSHPVQVGISYARQHRKQSFISSPRRDLNAPRKSRQQHEREIKEQFNDNECRP